MPWGRADTGIQLSEFKTRMYRAVLALVKKHCPPPAVLLDVGCSFGGFLTEARKLGYHVAGSDIVPQAVDHVHSLGIPAEVSFSIRDIKLFENGTLDLITCLDCNYYWCDQPSELRHAFVKLKRGGYLAMRVVDKSWMCTLGIKMSKIAPKIGKKVLKASVNDHRFSMPVRSLLNVIQSSGFQVVYISPRGAVHSHNSRWAVRALFALGSFLWATSGIFMAPGAVIFARKPVI